MVAVEEEPVEEVLRQLVSESQNQRRLLFWDIVSGWSDNGSDKGSPMPALARIGNSNDQEQTIFVILITLKNPFQPTPTIAQLLIQFPYSA